MHCEGVSQPVWTHSVNFTALGVDQVGQAGFLSALSYDLPGSSSVDVEDKVLVISDNGPAPPNIILEHLQCVRIHGQCSHASTLLFLGYDFRDLLSAMGAERVASPESSTTLRTIESDATLKVLNDYAAMFKINMSDFQIKSLADTVTKVEEHVNEKPIPAIGGLKLKQTYFIWFEVRLHSCPFDAGRLPLRLYTVSVLSLYCWIRRRAIILPRSRSPLS